MNILEKYNLSPEELENLTDCISEHLKAIREIVAIHDYPLGVIPHILEIIKTFWISNDQKISKTWEKLLLTPTFIKLKIISESIYMVYTEMSTEECDYLTCDIEKIIELFEKIILETNHSRSEYSRD